MNTQNVEIVLSEDKRKATVKTPCGSWTVTKPKAGVRNKALERAETENGFKRMILLTTMLPRCISSRPDNFDKDVPIDQVLENLEIEDYDPLIDALGHLLDPSAYEEEQTKK